MAKFWNAFLAYKRPQEEERCLVRRQLIQHYVYIYNEKSTVNCRLFRAVYIFANFVYSMYCLYTGYWHQTAVTVPPVSVL